MSSTIIPIADHPHPLSLEPRARASGTTRSQLTRGCRGPLLMVVATAVSLGGLMSGCKEHQPGQRDRGWHRRDYSGAQLIRAALDGDLQVVKACLNAGVDVNGGDASSRGAVTPLACGALGRHPSVVQALLEAGADPNLSADHYGRTPLMLASSKSDIESVRLLIAAGAIVSAVDHEGVNALMTAAAGDCAECVETLIRAGADVRSTAAEKSDYGTALDFAAEKGNFAAIESLISAGAVVPNEASLLHLAVALKRADVVQAYIASGADLNAKDVYGRTPLHYDQLTHSDAFKAVEVNGRMQLVGVEATITKMLLEAGADVNAPDDLGQTALHLASISFHEDRIRWLIAAGADPSIKSASGFTAAEVFRRAWETIPRPTSSSEQDRRADLLAFSTQLALLEGRDAVAAAEAVLQGHDRSSDPLMHHAPPPPGLVVKAVLSSDDGAQALIGYQKFGRRTVGQRTVHLGDRIQASGVDWEVVEIDLDERSIVVTNQESGASHVIAMAR